MSSPRRYQSNLLNFLSRQSIRLRDQTGQAWRQAKTAAVWGAQIVLFPIYMGFQATRLAGKQLRQTARQVLPKLRAVQQRVQPVSESEEILLADTPIQRSLQLLNDLSLVLPADRLALQLDPHDPSSPGMLVVVGGSALAQPEVPVQQAIALQGIVTTGIALSDVASTNAMQPTAIRIQGIACLLNHKLVLVSLENQLLDVLSPEQQVILQRRIVGDVATYWRQQVLGTSPPAALVDRFLPLPKDRPQALPPIRAFWQLMSWIQASPVAIVANLFQESRLIHALPPAESPRLPGVANLRSAQSAWKTGDEILEGLNHWFRSRIQILKNAALQPIAPPPELLNASQAQQPWLTQDDLFSQNQPASGWIARLTSQFNPHPTMAPALPAGEPQPADLPNSLTQPDRTPRSPVRPSTRLPLASRLPATDSPPQPASGTLATVSTAAPEDLVAQPTWIEAEVRLVTYEKHPLERLLAWIDRSMSWIEHKAGDVWQWLRDRWSA